MDSRDKKIVEDGEVVRVPFGAMDALQRSVAASQHALVVDAFGQPAGFRPGFCFSTSTEEDPRPAAYDSYKQRTSDAWQAGRSEPSSSEAKDRSSPQREEAYAQYVDYLTNAWRSGK